MQVTFRNLSSINSAPDSLRGSDLLTPPASTKDFAEIPFKPGEDDRTSLKMKRTKSHRPKRGEGSFRQAAAAMNIRGRRYGSRGSGSRHQSQSLRKAQSFPSIQPRFEHGAIETVQLPASSQQKARRWTIPSKALSTQAVSTLIPVGGKAKADADTSKSDSSQSPAMITLRRATTSRCWRHTTFTSFPPPRFNPVNTGILSMFLCSIAGYDESLSAVRSSKDMETAGHVTTQKSRRMSTVRLQKEGCLSTTTVAPPVRTEVVAVEPRPSDAEQNPANSSIRRCSTRYMSDNTTYEVIWDENWSSSTSSAGSIRDAHGRGSMLQNRNLTGKETLERRLSSALTRSRRESEPNDEDRKTSYQPVTEFSVQSLWNNPKVARLFREPDSERLPRSKFSKRTSITPFALSRRDLKHNTLPDGSDQTKTADHVEFFPPLRSRANTNGSQSLDDLSTTTWRGNSRTVGGADSDSSAELLGPKPGRSRYGSMVGISSGTKRRNLCADTYQHHRSVKTGGRRAS